MSLQRRLLAAAAAATPSTTTCPGPASSGQGEDEGVSGANNQGKQSLLSSLATAVTSGTPLVFYTCWSFH